MADVKVSPNLVSAGRPAQIDATVINNGTKDVPGHDRQADGRRQAGHAAARGRPRRRAVAHAALRARLHRRREQLGRGFGRRRRRAAGRQRRGRLGLRLADPAGADHRRQADQRRRAVRRGRRGRRSRPRPASSRRSAAFRNSRFLQMAMLSDAASPDAPVGHPPDHRRLAGFQGRRASGRLRLRGRQRRAPPRPRTPGQAGRLRPQRARRLVHPRRPHRAGLRQGRPRPGRPVPDRRRSRSPARTPTTSPPAWTSTTPRT